MTSRRRAGSASAFEGISAALLLVVVVALTWGIDRVSAFSCNSHRLTPQRFRPTPERASSTHAPPIPTTKNSRLVLWLQGSGDDSGGDEEFSRDVRLREEAESPFRKVRFWLYLVLGGGASISLAVSVARIGAASAGINADLLEESLTNAAIDVVGLGIVALLYQRDARAQESRMKRASKGAELAKLQVRSSESMLLESDDDDDDQSSVSKKTFTTSLASLRRGRGIEKRVVIAAAGAERIAQILQQAQDLQASLLSSDLLIVPAVLPEGAAPSVATENESATVIPNAVVALPTGGYQWRRLIQEEAAEAASQGVDLTQEGFCVILKKNGRVGQRTRGIYLSNMVGEVLERQSLGLDVKNI